MNNKIQNIKTVTISEHTVLDRLTRAYWLMAGANIICEALLSGALPGHYDADEAAYSISAMMWEAQTEVSSVSEEVDTDDEPKSKNEVADIAMWVASLPDEKRGGVVEYIKAVAEDTLHEKFEAKKKTD